MTESPSSPSSSEHVEQHSTGTEITSDLHPKHEQDLLSAYEDADWLCGTLDGMQYISVPSHLRSVRDTLEGILIEQELLEHLLACERCGYTDYRSVKRTSLPECPNCDTHLKYQRTERSKSRSPSTGDEL